MKMKTPYASVVGALLALIALAAFTPLGFFVQARPMNSQKSAILPEELEVRASILTSEMKAAPLFEKSRKPFVVIVAPPPKLVERDPFMGWRLSGVMGTSTGEPASTGMVAWLQKGSEPTKKIKVGDDMFGWKVSLIEAGRVEFTKNEKIKILEQGK